ncbi:MAG: hypothetical protein JRM74_05025 [Nitrososphaerota archaeon]|nr:hypothetical protein [Nitrososphaerota archaeon]
MKDLGYIVIVSAVVGLIALASYVAIYPGPAPPTGSTTATVQGVVTELALAQTRPLSVWATTSPGESGLQVNFYVNYQNTGPSDLSYLGGCGGSLNAQVASGGQVLRTIYGSPPCECPEVNFVMTPGSNTTGVVPGCWDSYRFLLAGRGTVSVEFTLTSGPGQNATTQMLVARFDFG